jgi:predicted enzyme related to lactoylglutathione lyase
MNGISNISLAAGIALIINLLTSCADHSKKTTNPTEAVVMAKKSNPVVYYEIPVTDMDRAVKFYAAVFHFDFEKATIDSNEMALFPFTDENTGISGALAKGDIYKPTKDGILIYFNTESIDETLRLATSSGGKILYARTDNGVGLVAEFEDTEGNRIALYQSKE